MNNINKTEFNNSFTYYITLPVEDKERYYTKHIHKHIITIIKNACYHYKFDNIYLTYEDVCADLLYHYLYKQDKIEQYSGNFYNVLFSIFTRKLLDILRSHKGKEKRRQTLLELRNDYNYLLYRGEQPKDTEDYNG